MTAPTFDLTITKGKTLAQSFGYHDEQLVYRSVTAMPSKAPVRLTVTWATPAPPSTASRSTWATA